VKVQQDVAQQQEDITEFQMLPLTLRVLRRSIVTWQQKSREDPIEEPWRGVEEFVRGGNSPVEICRYDARL
jgi:hypothetical protein